MPPKIIHRVFVSSTFEDLREERSEVQKALLKLNCFPVGMELFPSADDETWKFIKRQISESDYYVVIVAGRYGSLASDGLSYTEKEFDFAREIGKPSIAFVHGDPENLPARVTEIDASKRTKLTLFIQKLKANPVCSFTTPHELATQVLASIVNLRDRYPAPGYVQADKVPDLKRHAELLEENLRLRSEVERLRNDAPFRGAHVICPIEVSTGEYNVPTWTSIACFTSSWGSVFVALGDALIKNDMEEDELERNLALNLNRDSDTHHGGRVKNFDAILKQFFGLGLIAFYQQKEERLGFMGTTHLIAKYWKLTDYGQRQYGLLRDITDE